MRIFSLKFIEFQDMVECDSMNFHSRESFLPINYEFKPGNVYGLISDFGCGSWGLSTCIGGRFTTNHSGKILLNKNEITSDELKKYGCFVCEKNYEILNIKDNFSSPRECIEKALSFTMQPYSSKQIKEMFSLSNERFERPLSYASGEIWLISIAINFALGKQIFCYPWLNEIDIGRFQIANTHNIIRLLKDTGKIVIIPSSQKNILRKNCDHTILFHKSKVIFR